VIAEAGMGDPDNWSVKAADEKRPTNIMHVKPGEANARTNLHLRTAAGHIYSFLLTEVSSCPACQPDLKVFVEPPPDVAVGLGAPEPNHKQEMAELKAQIERFRGEAQRAKADASRDAAKQVSAYRSQYPVSLACDYSFRFNQHPFFVQAICSDGTFTYIKSGAQEMPSLYMEKDGKPALVKFDFRSGKASHEGTYIIDSVMRRGYLQLGKRKLKFQARS